MTEPTLADVIRQLEGIEKRLASLEALALMHSPSPSLEKGETYQSIMSKPLTKKLTIELDREKDGRIIAQDLPLEVLGDRVKQASIQLSAVLKEKRYKLLYSALLR